MNETATATFDLAPEEQSPQPAPQFHLTAEDIEEIRANYRLTNFRTRFGPPYLFQIIQANTASSPHRVPEEKTGALTLIENVNVPVPEKEKQVWDWTLERGYEANKQRSVGEYAPMEWLRVTGQLRPVFPWARPQI